MRIVFAEIADGTRTLVDAEDEPLARKYKWRLDGAGYLRRTTHVGGRPDRGGRRATYFLHREILGLPSGDPRVTDHINGDRLDNRRANLRVATRTSNRQNLLPVRGTSRYRGVTYEQGAWIAGAKLEGRRFYLGRFECEECAALVAHCWRLRHMPLYEPFAEDLGRLLRHVEGPCPAPRLRLPADQHGPLVRPAPLVRGERRPRQVRP